jgi:uncharacterized PurR-regulated membrane protein YhhQ (DUF165 family)
VRFITKNDEDLRPPKILIIIFCLILLATNILVKWQITFWDMTVTVGLLIYPLTFLITDYISEIYGKTACQKLVAYGFLFAIVPSLVFSTLQITIGSLLAYLVAQYHDVWSFHWWKYKTNGRFLWIRNNASTIISQLLDTLIFTPIAFYGVLDNNTIFTIMYSEYTFKVIYALLDTFPLYLFVGLSKKR